jgi:hypothetical protein
MDRRGTLTLRRLLILSPFPSISSIHYKTSPEFSKTAVD